MMILPNGLKVLYRQDATFPLVSSTLLFDSGARQEARSEEGLASMTMDLLMQGTRRRNAKDIARIMESVGASMGTQGHEDYGEMGFVVPAAELSRALRLMTEVLVEPSFPSEEIIKEKAHVVAGLESRKDEIFNVAYDRLSRSQYGHHPYGRPLEGTEASVRGFKRSDFKAWHARYLRPEGSVLSMIGPMAEKTAEKLIKKELSSWSSSRSQFRHSPRSLGGNPSMGPPSPTGDCPAPLGSKGCGTPVAAGDDAIKEIRAPFQQAYLMIGFMAPEMGLPDHIPLKVLNTLLGGGMSSRLFMELREKLGLAYEVSSFYPSRLDASQWVLYLGLPVEKLPAAYKKLHDILKNLAERGPKPQEVVQAKAMIRGAFLMDRQSRRRQAWYYAWWEFLGRGPHYGEEFLSAVDAVSAKTLKVLIQKILKTPQVTVKVIPK